MNENHTLISMQEIFEAVRKCRSGDLSNEVAETLIAANLLRGVMHVGSAPAMRIVFARALKNKWQEAEAHIRNKLAPHASLRYTTTFGVDFIVSGQLPDTWAEDEIAKKSNLFEDLYEAEVTAVKRYRWATPTRTSNLRSRAKLVPLTVTDVANFLTEPKQVTRLVYDSSRLPSLSCLAVITPAEGRDLDYIWDHLDEKDQQPVRDMFTNDGDKARLDTGAMDRAIRAIGYAFCEFDSISSTGNGSFTPAMNQAYHWRRRMMDRHYIQQVRLIPCAVIVESIDYYDELDETNDRMERFKPTVRLPYGTRQTGAKESQISFPIWNAAICGGPGSGKSVFAYVLAAALLKEEKYDLVYVNYKNSDDTETLDPQPRNEALEFAKVIEHIAQTGITLVAPDAIENSISRQATDKPTAWYTECAKSDRAKPILKAIFAAHEKRSKKPPGMFVIFDEILNQKENLKEDMASLLVFVNEKRSSNIFLGIIHQDLTEFWADESARTFIEKSTVVLGSSLSGRDEDRYKWLSARAESMPLPISPVTFDEVRRFQKHDGKFVFLPHKAGDSEHPLRHILPEYAFLKAREPIPHEWTWGFTTTISTSS
jgi:hypothetical protein